MASCGGSGSVNCSDLHTPVTRTVLPDIVGIGVSENLGFLGYSRRRKPLITSATIDLNIISDYGWNSILHSHTRIFHGLPAW
jgi:hypothetical protein